MIDFKSVSIIVPHLGATKEQEYAFTECYRSLKETVPDIRIIVAKNGNVPCLDHGCDIHIKDQGQCKVVNAAVAMVDTEWIFVTNDDMIYVTGWWEKLTENMIHISNPVVIGQNISIQCISPQLVEPISGAPTFIKYFCGGAGGDFDKQKWLEFAKNYQGQGIRTGFNLPFLIKRELFNLVGQYDIQMDPWGSNSDSCLQTRIMLAGVQPYQNTNSVVYHFSTTSGGSNPSYHSFWENNWHYYIKKYGFPRADSPMIWKSENIIQYDKLIYRPEWMGKYGNPK